MVELSVDEVHSADGNNQFSLCILHAASKVAVQVMNIPVFDHYKISWQRNITMFQDSS